MTRELVRFSDDRAMNLLEAFMLRALRLSEDRALLSDAPAVSMQQPAGLLAGLSAVGGGSPESLDTALEDMWLSVRDGDAQRPVFILSPRAAMYLANLRTTDGAVVFPGIGPLGGTLLGVPVVTSRAAGEHVILVDASALAVVDDGLEVEPSEVAAVAMEDAPTAPSAVISAFQVNCVFLKFTRHIQLGADARRCGGVHGPAHQRIASMSAPVGTREEYLRACHRAGSDPLSMTDRDFEVLESSRWTTRCAACFGSKRWPGAGSLASRSPHPTRPRAASRHRCNARLHDGS